MLEKIYNEYYKIVCFCISKNVQGDALIEDLAQDTFIRFFENARTVRGSAKYCLVKVANNLNLGLDHIDYDGCLHWMRH